MASTSLMSRPLWRGSIAVEPAVHSGVILPEGNANLVAVPV